MKMSKRTTYLADEPRKEKTDMPDTKTIPQPGDLLVHRLKGQDVVAKVISVDQHTGKIKVIVNDTTYSSLSAAGEAVAGHSTNGWIFWGLKKQISKQNTGSKK